MSYIAKQQFDHILYLFRTVLLLLSQTYLRAICSDLSSKLAKPVRMLSLNVCQLFKHYLANKDITNARQRIYQHLVIWFSGVTIIYPHYSVTWNRSDVLKNNTFNSSKKRGVTFGNLLPVHPHLSPYRATECRALFVSSPRQHGRMKHGDCHH